MKDVVVGPDEARMRYVDLPGHEPTRVFLHGLGSSSPAYFARIAADPGLGAHRSLLLDFLGFGISDRPAGFGYGLRDHALSVARALDALGVRHADIVAHSMGGSIAIILASERPDLVRRLVVAEPNLVPTRRPRLEGHTEQTFVAEGFARALAAVGPHWAATMRLADPLALYRSERSLGEVNDPMMKDLLRALSVPCTYIKGSLTGVTAHERAVQSAGIPVIEVADAGHNMMLDNPAGFLRALRTALA